MSLNFIFNIILENLFVFIPVFIYCVSDALMFFIHRIFSNEVRRYPLFVKRFPHMLYGMKSTWFTYWLWNKKVIQDGTYYCSWNEFTAASFRREELKSKEWPFHLVTGINWPHFWELWWRKARVFEVNSFTLASTRSFLNDFVFFVFLFSSLLSFFIEIVDFFDVLNSSNLGKLSGFMVSDWSFFSGAAESFDAAIPSTTDSENFDNYFGADPLADLLTFILVFLSVVVVFSGDDGTSDDRSYSNYSIFLFFLFQVLLDISISTVDLFLFFIAFEMFTIPMFLFFAICGSRDRRMRAFNYFFWYTVFGSIPFLAGILYIRYNVGSTLYCDIVAYPFSYEQQKIIWLLLAPAIFFKIPLCPFHLWLPEAHVEAPTTVSIFLAGILLKIGGYAYIRFLIGFAPLGNYSFYSIVMTLAIASCIWPAMSALWQVDMKRIIAYMSVAHMAVAIISLNTYTLTGFYSGLYNFVSHGIISSALFLLVGILYENYKTRHLWYYSGLSTTMPLFSLYLLFFIFCNIGFPGSTAFVAELTAFISLLNVSFVLLLFVLFSAFLLVFVNLWLLHILFGPPNVTYIKRYQDVEFWSGDHFALFTLAFTLIAVGLFPDMLFSALEELSEYYFVRLASVKINI